MLRDGLADADVGATAGAVAKVGAAGLIEEILTLGRGAWACAALEPTVSRVTLTAATAHTATATAAIAAPGLLRMLSHFQLIASENLANHAESAREATRRRYATASSAWEQQWFKTCSRSSGGSGASGSRRENAAGRSAPCP